MSKPVVLVSSGHPGLRSEASAALAGEDHEIRFSEPEATALAATRVRPAVLVVIVDRDHFDAVRQARAAAPGIPVIVVALENSEALAVNALRAGVRDYYSPPFAWPEFAAAVRNCASAGGPASVSAARTPMLGDSPPMREVREYLAKVARSDTNVMITGETGTGKELAVRAIHEASARRAKPLVCINSAAVPDTLLESELFGYECGAFTGAHSRHEGKLRQANGGTIVFDEVGDMSPFAQAKILRAIEQGEVPRLGGKREVPVDVRVMAATNGDLESLVAEGKFRRDLYFRLNVARVHLPPLRERKEDIPALLHHFVGKLNRQFGRDLPGVANEVMELFVNYDWPGNVRELKNVLEAIFVNSPVDDISIADVPKVFLQQLQRTAAAGRSERERLLTALLTVNWNKSRAAKALQWSRMTLYRKMAKYNLAVPGETASD